MTEPRMRLRQKGQQFPSQDSPQTALFDTKAVEAFLIAFGDDEQPLPETVKVLDEIVTDYIIETCHEAASVAHHARRAKIKLDDFKFMLRRDTTKLGRVSEMLERDKMLKQQRKAFDTDEGTVALAKDVDEEPEAGAQDGGGGGGGGGGGKASKARSEAGSKRGAPGGGDAEGEERRKKKKKKNKERGEQDARSAHSG